MKINLKELDEEMLKNPKEWICKKCGLDMNWENEKGEMISPNYCQNCRKPSDETHFYKKLEGCKP